MKAAAFNGPGDIRLADDVAVPDISDGEVLIKVEACGICGSDLHMYRTNAHRSDLVRNVDGVEVPGHEFAGVITQVGSNVSGFQVGEAVVGVAMGGFAEYSAVPANPYQLIHIPQGVSFEEAATTEPLADALQMLRLASIQEHENVVVIGVGIIGLSLIQAIRASDVNVGKLIAVDVNAPRLQKAMDLGATHVINSREQSLEAEVYALCGERVMHVSPFRAPDVGVVFDCAGYLKHMSGPAPFQMALDILKPAGGRLICFGAFEGAVSLDLMPIIHKQISIKGSHGYDPADLKYALSLMAEGKVSRSDLISHRFPLDQISDAFKTQGGPSAVKVMVRM